MQRGDGIGRPLRRCRVSRAAAGRRRAWPGTRPRGSGWRAWRARPSPAMASRTGRRRGRRSAESVRSAFCISSFMAAIFQPPTVQPSSSATSRRRDRPSPCRAARGARRGRSAADRRGAASPEAPRVPVARAGPWVFSPSAVTRRDDHAHASREGPPVPGAARPAGDPDPAQPVGCRHREAAAVAGLRGAGDHQPRHVERAGPGRRRGRGEPRRAAGELPRDRRRRPTCRSMPISRTAMPTIRRRPPPSCATRPRSASSAARSRTGAASASTTSTMRSSGSRRASRWRARCRCRSPSSPAPRT